MLKQAEAVLGYDLLKLCLEGPKEKLDDTVYSQPALYVAGLAAVERLRAEDSAAVHSCSATAGQPQSCTCAEPHAVNINTPCSRPDAVGPPADPQGSDPAGHPAVACTVSNAEALQHYMQSPCRPHAVALQGLMQ